MEPAEKTHGRDPEGDLSEQKTGTVDTLLLQPRLEKVWKGHQLPVIRTWPSQEQQTPSQRGCASQMRYQV